MFFRLLFLFKCTTISTEQTKRPLKRVQRSFRNRRLPILPGRFQPSTFGVWGLNCRVRDGNGWIPPAIATGYDKPYMIAHLRWVSVLGLTIPFRGHRVCTLTTTQERRRDEYIPKSRPRPIRIRQLHPLPDFHTGPINPVIYRGPYSLA